MTTATATAERHADPGHLRRDTPPKHGPYGRAEQVGRRWVVRLTAEGQRVVTDWLAEKSDLAGYFGTCFPGVLAYARAARMSDDEIDAACRRGLCLAVVAWRPEESTLTTTAKSWMRSAVQRDAEKLTRCHRQTGRGEVFDRPIGDDGRASVMGTLPAKNDGGDADAERAERRAKLMTALRRLPERDRIMFGLVHGLADGVPMTMREVAAVYDVSHQRVQQVCKRVAERLADACGGLS